MEDDALNTAKEGDVTLFCEFPLGAITLIKSCLFMRYTVASSFGLRCYWKRASNVKDFEYNGLNEV